MAKAPGKSHRRGLTFLQVSDMFRDEDTARDWIASQRWPDGPHCPRCGSVNVQAGIAHKTMTHRCRDCNTGKSKTMFSIKTGTVMEGSNLKYRAWAVGIYVFTCNIKEVSSMRLHRELGISQKAAWFMLHRLRLAFDAEVGPFTGPVEVDETHIGGKRKNKPLAKRKTLEGRDAVDMTTVAGAKDHETNKIAARVVENTDKPTMQGFVRENAIPGATVYTDEAHAYKGMPEFNHEAVNHSVSEYVREMASNHSGRPSSAGMEGKRLRYSDLTAGIGLDSGARS